MGQSDRVCTFQDEPWRPGGGPLCGNPAVFTVRQPMADPVHPDPGRDGVDCCRDHVAVVIEEADEPEPGYVVAVTVITSVQERVIAIRADLS